MRELVFLLSADADIQKAYEFYEAYQAGRGDVFMRHLDTAFGRLRIFPEGAPVFHKGYRRLLVQGFPYGIFYTTRAAVSSLQEFWISGRTRARSGAGLVDDGHSQTGTQYPQWNKN
ncbi:MAG: type II toxin-antitoxin system RelE/ParE family toxin [Verrucomicrobiota bacterium]